MNEKKVRTSELFDCEVPYLKRLFEENEYPWQMLSKIGALAEKLVSEGIEGFERIADGVIVGRDVVICKNVTVEPPAVIGRGCVLRPGAFVRGNVITGEKCVIGNSTELKNCILLDRVQVPHYNYVGDSVLGNGVHLGAGAICSNLKADKSDVAVKGDKVYKTGVRKFGAALADFADIGCGCVLNPGTVVGKNTSIYPLVSVRGVVSEGMIVKNSENSVVREVRKCAE